MGLNCACGKISRCVAEIHARVLVIDDEPLVRWSIVAGLRHAGIAAFAAADLEEARRLAHLPPDLTLLDLRLWGTDPRKLLDDVRGIAPDARILILAVEGQELPLSAWNDVDVIRKPFDLDQVVRRVQEALTCPPHDVRMAV